MNISTGGPHILLFERDQQLAALLMSELQLTGYEGHTARTAVEVFDAIARYPVRLVLVNLAQAAAARREFWVALDTQRRGSSIQVLNFRCANLAGYGPRDFEEHSATAADLEVDGMPGMMRLVEVIRARVPNADVNANTVPRMSRTTPSASAMTARLTQPIPVPNTLSTNNIMGSGSVSRNILPDEGNGRLSVSRMSASSLPHTPPSVTPVPSVQPARSFSAPQVHQTSQMSAIPSSSENSQMGYSDKIRAVIYPSQQRNWNVPNATNQEVSQSQNAPARLSSLSQSPAHSASDTPVLQRLADGQIHGGTSGESGLAQLTRMVQESQVPDPVPPVESASPNDTYVLPTYTPSTARVGSASEALSLHSLRPAPIEDLPAERVVTHPLNTDGQRRPDVLSRANYRQQSSTQIPPSVVQSPLASIATSGVVANSPSASVRREAVEGANQPVISKDAQRSKEEDLATLMQAMLQTRAGDQRVEREADEQFAQGYTEISSSEHKWERQEERWQDEVRKQGVRQQDEVLEQEERQQDEVQSDDDEIVAKNSVILDILQSLPPMPAIGQQQAVQPQVLHGRITRSLGRVLLDGHLVPKERLEVAQNIQRMLRGVDLNYQLGEILLMFKLLTPDQLLAASLVSYGLITTTQISAFGRIRQELHSLGLEYDLENLLVLFRVLTPEQLREARSSIHN